MRSGLHNTMMTTLILCSLLGGATLLGGCCTANLTLRKCPARIDLNVTAGQHLNSCTDQGSYQVMVRVYSLANPTPFHAADFEDLWFQESDLGGAVIDVQKLTVKPGTTLRHRWLRPPGTRAVGVVANFCRLDTGCWKQIVEVADGSRTLDLNLDGTCLTLDVR
jgi:type VI secretion system protein VasD